MDMSATAMATGSTTMAAMTTSAPSSSEMGGMDMGMGGACKISVLCIRSDRYLALNAVPDALELVHHRFLLPLLNMARQVQWRICRQLYWCYLPCDQP